MYGIQTWHDGRLMHSRSAHFDDLDLDARSDIMGWQRQKFSVVELSQQLSKQQLRIKPITFVLRDLDFENVYMA